MRKIVILCVLVFYFLGNTWGYSYMVLQPSQIEQLQEVFGNSSKSQLLTIKKLLKKLSQQKSLSLTQKNLLKDIEYIIEEILSQNYPTPQNALEILRETMLENINTLRSQNGLPALILNDTLNTIAQDHAHDMYVNEYFSHTSQDGTSYDTRLKNSGYKYLYIGENISRGPKTIESVMSLWLESEIHKNNILNPHFTQIGIGFENNIWVQNFGTPLQ